MITLLPDTFGSKQKYPVYRIGSIWGEGIRSKNPVKGHQYISGDGILAVKLVIHCLQHFSFANDGIAVNGILFPGMGSISKIPQIVNGTGTLVGK